MKHMYHFWTAINKHVDSSNKTLNHLLMFDHNGLNEKLDSVYDACLRWRRMFTHVFNTIISWYLDFSLCRTSSISKEKQRPGNRFVASLNQLSLKSLIVDRFQVNGVDCFGSVSVVRAFGQCTVCRPNRRKRRYSGRTNFMNPLVVAAGVAAADVTSVTASGIWRDRRRPIRVRRTAGMALAARPRRPCASLCGVANKTARNPTRPDRRSLLTGDPEERQNSNRRINRWSRTSLTGIRNTR